MSKKLWSVQAVDKGNFNNRPAQPAFGEPLVLRIPMTMRSTVLHTTEKKARAEAERLARLHKDNVYLVMEAVHMAYTNDLVSDSLRGDF